MIYTKVFIKFFKYDTLRMYTLTKLMKVYLKNTLEGIQVVYIHSLRRYCSLYMIN